MSTPEPPPASNLPPVPPNIASITAPLMFGIMISWAFYGILVVQVYIYHLCFSKDKRAFKLLVYGVFVLDTLQTTLTGVDAWYWFCAGFGNLIHLSNPYISAFDTPMLGSVISLVVQWFFCYRIWTLSKSRWLSGLIASISLMQVIAAFISGIRGHIVGNFAVARAHIDLVSLYIWLIGSAVADAMIAASMSYLLMRSRRDEHRQTSEILYRIVRLTVETNILSAGIALMGLIIYFAAPDASYFICPTFILGKIYSNTLLVAFNNRVFLARQGQTQTLNSSSGWSSSTRHPPTPLSPAVHIHRSQFPSLPDERPFGDSYKMEAFNEIGRGVDVSLTHIGQSPPAKELNTNGFGL